jgi:hypothetical protein
MKVKIKTLARLSDGSWLSPHMDRYGFTEKMYDKIFEPAISRIIITGNDSSNLTVFFLIKEMKKIIAKKLMNRPAKIYLKNSKGESAF